MKIMLTGGCGYIGTHTAIVLIQAGYDLLLVDNLSNSSAAVVERIRNITGTKPSFIEADIRDFDKLVDIFSCNDITAVMHFGGLKSVSESCENPLAYYENNVAGTLSLLKAMNQSNVDKVIFSSSATVYGSSCKYPCKESYGRGITVNPYGTSKSVIEQILEDLVKSDPRWSVAILRYFNPVGAHESGLVGESPIGPVNNLMPIIAQVASGLRSELKIFGDDYDTPDGTCLRDYIHVMDLAEGHLAALKRLEIGCRAYNLGTGVPTSVKEMVRVFESENKLKIPTRTTVRRDGDLAAVWADTSLASTELCWKAKRGLSEMVTSTWNWAKNNPKGFS